MYALTPLHCLNSTATIICISTYKVKLPYFTPPKKRGFINVGRVNFKRREPYAKTDALGKDIVHTLPP